MSFYVSAAIAVLSGLASSAAVLTYGSFTAADPDSSETKASFGSNGGALAIGFATSRAGYSLSSIAFDLSRSSNAGTTARLRVYSGSSPTTLLATRTAALTGAANAASVVTFGSVSINLSTSSTYWLVIDSDGGTVQLHSATGNQTASGATGLSLTAYRTYNEALTSFTGGAVPADLPNFKITVPEPEHYAVAAALGLLLFGLHRRNNKFAAKRAPHSRFQSGGGLD